MNKENDSVASHHNEEINRILDNTPDFEELVLSNLYSSITNKSINEDDINKLEEFLQNEGIDAANDIRLIKNFAENGDYGGLKAKYLEIIDQTYAINFNSMIKLIKQTVKASIEINGQDIILFLGVTGAGKSTTIHFLAGSKMVEAEIDGLEHIKPENLPYEELNTFCTSNSQRSETKTINTIKIPFKRVGDEIDDNYIVLCDTPGFADTDGVEADIANGIGIINAVRMCKSVRPVVLISQNSIGDRGEGILNISQTLVKLISLNELPKIQYIFTKYYDEKRKVKQINQIIRNKLKNLTPNDRRNEAFVALLEDMIEKTEAKLLVLNPLQDDPNNVLLKLTDPNLPTIDNPSDVFKYFVTPESNEKLKLQLNKHCTSICLALNRFDLPRLKYKLAQLYYLSINLNINETEKIYKNSINLIASFIENKIMEMFEKLDKIFLSPKSSEFYNNNNEQDGGEFKVCIEIMKNIIKLEDINQFFSTNEFKILNKFENKFKSIQCNLYNCIIERGMYDLMESSTCLNKMKFILETSQNTLFINMRTEYDISCGYLLNLFDQYINETMNLLDLELFDKYALNLSQIKEFIKLFTNHFDINFLNDLYASVNERFLFEKCLNLYDETMSYLVIHKNEDTGLLTLSNVTLINKTLLFLDSIINVKKLQDHLDLNEIREKREKIIHEVVKYFNNITVKIDEIFFNGNQQDDCILCTEIFLKTKSYIKLMQNMKDLLIKEIESLIIEKYFYIMNKLNEWISSLKTILLAKIDNYLQYNDHHLDDMFFINLMKLKESMNFFEQKSYNNNSFIEISNKLSVHIKQTQRYIMGNLSFKLNEYNKLRDLYELVKKLENLKPCYEIILESNEIIEKTVDAFTKKILKTLDLITFSEAKILHIIGYLSAISNIHMVSDQYQLKKEQFDEYFNLFLKKINENLRKRFEYSTKWTAHDENDNGINDDKKSYFNLLSKLNKLKRTLSREEFLTSKKIYQNKIDEILNEQYLICTKHIETLMQNLNVYESESNLNELYKNYTISKCLKCIDLFLNDDMKYSSVIQAYEISIIRINNDAFNKLRIDMEAHRYKSIAATLNTFDLRQMEIKKDFDKFSKELHEFLKHFVQKLLESLSIFELDKIDLFDEFFVRLNYIRDANRHVCHNIFSNEIEIIESEIGNKLISIIEGTDKYIENGEFSNVEEILSLLFAKIVTLENDGEYDEENKKIIEKFNEKIKAKYERIKEKFQTIISKYSQLNLENISDYSPNELFNQLNYLTKTFKHANVEYYADFQAQFNDTIKKRINSILDEINVTKNIEEGVKQLEVLIEYIRLHLPSSFIAQLEPSIKTCKEYIKNESETNERKLKEVVIAGSLRELIDFTVDLIKAFQFKLAYTAQQAIIEKFIELYRQLKTYSDKKDLTAVFETFPSILDDHVFYIYQLGKINELASQRGLSYDSEIFQNSVKNILKKVQSTLKSIIEYEINCNMVNMMPSSFDIIIAFLKFKINERVVENLKYLKLTFIQDDVDIKYNINRYFNKIQSYFYANKYPEAFCCKNLFDFAKLMSNSKLIEILYEKVKEFSNSHTYEVMCANGSLELREIFNNCLSYTEMKRKFGEQVLIWKNKCVDEAFLHNSRTESINAVDRDKFYIEICDSYKCIKFAGEALSQHFGNSIENMAVECREYIEKQINSFENPINDMLDIILENTVSVYVEFNTLYDNLRSIYTCFENTHLAQIAKGKICLIDSKFDAKLNELTQNLQNEASLEKIVRILIQIKSMSLKIPIYTKKIVERIDEILLGLKRQEDGTKKIGNIGVLLNQTPIDADIAQMLIAEHHAFKGYALYLRNQGTFKFTIDNLLSSANKQRGLRCVDLTNIENKSDIKTNVLMKEFKLFDKEYWSLVEQGLLSKNRTMSEIVQNSNALADGCDNNKVRKLMAHVFAYWTLSNSQYYSENKDIAHEDKRFYLLQPHSAQVIAIFRLFNIDTNETSFIDRAKILLNFSNNLKLNNHLVQILTGEGKSVILAVTATILALLGYNVDCVCYSNYLSTRDYNAFVDLFEAFDIAEFIHYGTFDKMCEDFINKDANIRVSVTSLIKNGPETYKRYRIEASARPQILLIDEVDVFFNKDFYGGTYNPIASINDPTITALINYIWNNRKNSCALIFKNISTTNEYKECLKRFKGWEKLFEKSVQEMLYYLSSLESHKYVLQNDKIGYKNQDEISFHTYDGYHTLFAYYKERRLGRVSEASLQSNIGLNLNCGNFSYAEIPKQYEYIMGVTGTLEALSEMEHDLLTKKYEIKKYSYIPSVFGENKLQFSCDSIKDFKITSKDDYFTEIRNEINLRLNQSSEMKQRRAVLVFFKTRADLEEFYNSDELTDMKERVRIMTEITSSWDKENIVRQAITCGSVTLLTREFGRGTDFICYDDTLNANGGVHVIQTFFSNEIAEETQIKGRTARQGNYGSFSFILNDKHLKKFGINEDFIREIRNTGKFYTAIDKKRREYFLNKHEKTTSKIDKIKLIHNKAIEFLGALVSSDVKKIKSFLLEINS